MEVKTTTDLSAEPILLAAAKNYIKATYGTDTVEDALIESMIKTARQLCEKYTNKSLGEKTLDIFYRSDEIINNSVKLPYGPHKSITSVSRINQQGTATALVLNTSYYSRGQSFLELEFLSNTINPWQEGSFLADDFKVTLVAGYGAAGTEALPQIFISAMYKLIGEWYLSREDYIPTLTSTVKRLLDSVSLNIGL